MTRPNIAYAVQVVNQFVSSPHKNHLSAVHRLLRYFKGTMSRGFFYSSTSSLSLQGYTDADWAGCPDTQQSTIGWCMFLGSSTISCKCKKQPTVSTSSAEAEYRAISSASSEIVWLRCLLKEFGVLLQKPTPLFADNTSAIQIAQNPVFHERTKHIDVRDKLSSNILHLPQDPS